MNCSKPPLQQSKTPLRTVPSPFQTRCIVDELSGDKGEHFGAENMVRTPINGRIRPGLSLANGSPDLGSESTPASNAGSEYGAAEFTREDVEALLTEKMKVKSKYNYKDRFENMMDYVRRLRFCIRWFQELEGEYAFEQEQLRQALELTERRCEETDLMLKKKEEELNVIILELKKSLASFHDRIAQEESAKLAAMGSLVKEKEATLGVEKSNASLLEELRKIQGELDSANQRITSINDMYNLLQEYKSSLQSCNSKIQSDLDTAQEAIKCGEKEKADIMENLSTLKGQYQSLQEQLSSSQASRSEAMKQKEALLSEVACLSIELQQMKDDHNSKQVQVQTLTAEVDNYKDKMAKRSIELEEKCLSQDNQIKMLHDQLLVAERKLQFSNVSALEARAEFEAQKKLINELQNYLEEKESKVKEGEKLRKKLHNTVLELKGNIRVFCRVRPRLLDDGSCDPEEVISYPTSMEASGRAIDLMQTGRKHSFTFDKVFMPEATQEDVFEEISQLVQSALDGYKVCIFAYGQTGSGKTYTMMGRPGEPEEKGLIPRSLEQIFQTKQALQPQGWKYEMQVSILEIYNETIRDLLATKGDALRTENGASAKQYAIKHDANGNTHVSDLTIVDIKSTKEVSFLLNQASESRSVGKTQMNEQSSRSHFVFTIRISGFNESTQQQVQGVLNLVDLAGSERPSKSGATGDRLKETQSINKSLSSLADVIFALAKKEDHVPFRNSKLTYLLQPCLGGDSKTLMFVNISPESSSVGESLCSLRFAARVNACEIGTPRRQTNTRSSESRLSYG